MEYLSPESYNLLKVFYNGLTIHDETLFDESCIQQLSDNGLIESHIVDYDVLSDNVVPCFSDYSITEKGKGYVIYREDSESFLNSVKEIADSAKVQSDLALKTSKKADVKGWIAVSISALGLIIETIINHSEIFDFISALF